MFLLIKISQTWKYVTGLKMMKTNVIAEHHGSDDYGQELTNTNHTVKNDEAVKNFNMCMKWAEKNNIILHDVFVPPKEKETTLVMNQKKVKDTKQIT